jgi:hypothetical protein
MGGSERLEPKLGPLSNLSQACFGNLDMVVKTYEPALKSIGRWNLELVGFMARRAQAWLETSSRLSKCKTPAEVLGEQARFWQVAAADYADGSRRLAAAWSSCAMAARTGNGAGQPRDYITFPEPQEAQDTPKRGERKAA